MNHTLERQLDMSEKKKIIWDYTLLLIGQRSEPQNQPRRELRRACTFPTSAKQGCGNICAMRIVNICSTCIAGVLSMPRDDQSKHLCAAGLFCLCFYYSGATTRPTSMMPTHIYKLKTKEFSEKVFSASAA